MTLRATVLTGALALAAMAPAAGAATLTFDLSGLADFFQLPPAPISGGFTFDTATSGFSGIAIATPLGSYADGSGTLIPDTAGFGFPEDIFSFDNGTTTFFFSLEGLDLGAPAIASGDPRTFDSVFAFESDVVFADFQIGLTDLSASYFGPVTISAADPSPVPLPATLPLLVAGLVGMRMIRRRRI